MKRWTTCLLLVLLLCGQSALAAETPDVSYDGEWTAVRESFLRVFLPTGWTVAPKDAMSSGLLATSGDGDIEMRIALAPAMEREMDEIVAACEADPAFSLPVQLYEEGAYPWALMNTEDGRGIAAVTETGMVFTVTVTFLYQGEGEAYGRDLSLEILRTISENPGNNG